ncbi:MAG: type II toxin-antitoxin system VapC family toxin [Rhodothermales bacterium]|nr:type II toxin-antitoxin system VapC family toxin [Rhodothermales bacterium]
MQVVVDTSVIMAVLAREPSRKRLIEATASMAFVAPSSLHWELGNALTARMKRGKATLEMVQGMLRDYTTIPIRRAEVALEHVLDVAAAENLYAYDAYMIACAQKYRLPLLTLDAQLARAAAAANVSLLDW